MSTIRGLATVVSVLIASAGATAVASEQSTDIHPNTAFQYWKDPCGYPNVIPSRYGAQISRLLEAEERGITQANVDDELKSADPLVQRLLGVKAGNGKALGLDEKWAYAIIKQVGNYGESFERNVGTFSTLGIPRGMNQLWSRGGIQYAPPVR